MKTLLTIIIVFITTFTKAQSDYDITLVELDQHRVGIVSGDNKMLYIETETDDKRVIGCGKDFYIIYYENSGKLFTKDKFGKIIKGMVIPDGYYVYAVDFGTMTEQEVYWANLNGVAFSVENLDTGEIKKYDKYCKWLGGKRE